MSGDFAGKVVIVTGAGRGMGKPIVQAFAAEGAKVMVAARTISYGEETVAELKAAGADAALCQVDVCKRDDIEKLIKETVSRFGGIDVVVHSAADVGYAMILDLEDAVVDLMLASTIKASVWLIQAAHPYLKESADGGRLILISSICGPRTTIPGMGHYAASKAGINALISTAALELAQDAITVNGIEPGVTGTDRFYQWTPAETQQSLAETIPAGRIGEPEEVARVALFLAHPKSSYITGKTIVIDGGVSLLSGQNIKKDD